MHGTRIQRIATKCESLTALFYRLRRRGLSYAEFDISNRQELLNQKSTLRSNKPPFLKIKACLKYHKYRYPWQTLITTNNDFKELYSMHYLVLTWENDTIFFLEKLPRCNINVRLHVSPIYKGKTQLNILYMLEDSNK